MSMVNHGRVVGPVEAGMIARAAAARARLLGGARRPDAPVAALAPPAPVVEPVVYQQPDEAEHVAEQSTETGYTSPREQALAVIRGIAKDHGFTAQQILGMSRVRPLCRARHKAIYTMHVRFGWSYQRIGRLFSDRDHTTVTNSIKVFTTMFPEEAREIARQAEADERRAAQLRNDVISEVADRYGLPAHEVGLWADEA